jgi:protein-tyrosine-phosphatase
MGIHALDGNSATENAVTVCSEHDIDISRHQSRQLVPEELKNSRLILTMEPVQVDYLTIFFPQVADRTYMLGSWPVQKSKGATIKDPVGRALPVYRKTFVLLQRTIERLMPEITAWGEG